MPPRLMPYVTGRWRASEVRDPTCCADARRRSTYGISRPRLAIRDKYRGRPGPPVIGRRRPSKLRLLTRLASERANDSLSRRECDGSGGPSRLAERTMLRDQGWNVVCAASGAAHEGVRAPRLSTMSGLPVRRAERAAGVRAYIAEYVGNFPKNRIDSSFPLYSSASTSSTPPAPPTSSSSRREGSASAAPQPSSTTTT